MRGVKRRSTTARFTCRGGSAAAAAAPRRPTHGRPPTELEAAYGDWYRPEGGSRFSFAGDAILKSTRGLLAGRIDSIAPPGPVLDVGAGDGTLLDALHRHGREATGLERSSDRADVRDDSLEDVGGEWAAVIFWHSLEHLPEPGDAIRQAARLLKPGGVIAVAVPEQREPAGGRVRRRLAASRPASPSRPPLRHEPAGRTSRLGLRDRAHLLQPRRADRDRLAGRPRRQAPRSPEPLSGTAAAPGPKGAAIGPAPSPRDRCRRSCFCRSRGSPPRSRWRCVAAGPFTLRGGVSEQETAGETTTEAKVIVVMPARQAAATLRETVAEIPLEHVDEIILVDDSSTDETVELARRAARPGRLASAPGRLRRQPEDLLPAGPAPRCRRRRDAPSGRAVRARPDPLDGRADHRGPRPISCSAPAC